MKMLSAIALAGVAAAALGGTAFAATQTHHVMNVALPDGTTAHVEYVGDIPPRITIDPVQPVAFGNWAPMPVFAGFDRMMEQLDREAQAMMQNAQTGTRQALGNGAGQYMASFGNAPSGVTSTTIVSYSNGNATCTRTTQTVSEGPGKPPKVSSTESGNCGSQSAAPAERGSAIVDHT